jgi:hypothetical protein
MYCSYIRQKDLYTKIKKNPRLCRKLSVRAGGRTSTAPCSSICSMSSCDANCWKLFKLLYLSVREFGAPVPLSQTYQDTVTLKSHIQETWLCFANSFQLLNWIQLLAGGMLHNLCPTQRMTEQQGLELLPADRQTDMANLKAEISFFFIHSSPNTVSCCPEEPYDCLETWYNTNTRTVLHDITAPCLCGHFSAKCVMREI